MSKSVGQNLSDNEIVELVDLVEIRQGTASTFEFSNGNTLPLIGAPFAMCNWAPQTASGKWYYHPQHRRLQGIRATRQPSPWIGDYGQFVCVPQSGARHLKAEARASAFKPEDVECGPDFYQVYLLRDQCTFSLTATERCSVMRVEYKKQSASKRFIIDVGYGVTDWEIDPKQQTIRGVIRVHSGGVAENFSAYVHIDCSAPMDAKNSGLFSPDSTQQGILSGSGLSLGCWLEFAEILGSVEFRIGTSFISCDQAQENLRREIGGKSFAAVRSSVREAWNKDLSVIDIKGADTAQRRTFYSALYRCFLFPRQIHEHTASGLQHYSPYDGQVHAGPMYTDNGFWDTHRTVYPLFSLLCPTRLAEMIEGWINAYKEGGWFPKWASPGYKACMIGTHIDAVIADAYVKNIPFDVTTAFEGLCKHAYTESDGSNKHGRLGLYDYIKRGWVPCDLVIEAASRTMDFAYNDWCIAQIARGLGENEKATDLLQRSKNYRNVYDKQVGFMRGRNADGSWLNSPYGEKDFSDIEWGGPFVEGSAWQCGWAVGHDVDGLIELMGGRQAFVAKLDQLMNTAPDFEIGSYPAEIHEMSEMAAVEFGQYAQSNQPSHHILYLYALAGRSDRTQYWVRRVCNELYAATPEGLPGDEDNGEMSAWYIFSALGFYPVCPGKPEYVLGSPLFAEASVRLESGKQFVISAGDNSLDKPFVKQWKLNQEVHTTHCIQHSDIINGAQLKATMSATVNSES